MPNTRISPYRIDPATLILSPEDEHLRNACPWRCYPPPKGGYPNGNWGFLHRQIAQLKLGRKLLKGEEVDHINGNRLDNRRENLRVVDHRLNKHNQHGGKGVTRTPNGKRWMAQASFGANGKRTTKYIGTYDTEFEARAAFKAWVLENRPGFVPREESPTGTEG